MPSILGQNRRDVWVGNRTNEPEPSAICIAHATITIRAESFCLLGLAVPRSGDCFFAYTTASGRIALRSGQVNALLRLESSE
jgi:hypothetical protein